jgi:hypothetical protein
MKNIFLILTILFTTISFAQEITKTKHKFYVDGNQIATYEAKNLIKNNPEAYKYFRAGKNKEAIGGLFMGFGIGFGVANALNAAASKIDYPSGGTYVALGAIAVSIPILIGHTKKIDKAVEIYNQGLKNTGQVEFEYNIVANQNGVGLQITF